MTDYTLDAFGLVRSTATYGGYTGSQSYIYDAADQGIVHAESYNAQSWTDNWYRMGGVNIWHYSNRFGYNAQTGDTANGLGGRYTVRSGDSFQSIAQALWGDATLWYKIAEANGLTAASSLTDGQSLIVPAGVFRNHQTASTFLPYDQNRFLQLAEPSPLFPSPAAAKAKCGAFGMILLAVIAIAAVAIIGPAIIGAPAVIGTGAAAGTVVAATGLTATLGSTGAFIVGGAIAGAAGSVISQAVGLVTGIQDKFSWKGVALGALGGAVGGALKGLDVFAKLGIGGNIAGSEFFGNVARGAVGSAINQGAAVVTGLQKKFD